MMIWDRATIFEKHRLSPDISLGQYTRSKQIELAYSLSKRLAVYLDTNFWIKLRNVDSGAPSNLEEEILRALRRGIAADRLFCPISESVFVELMKQNDVSSRTKMARLIDELSLGVSLCPPDQRVATEIAHFLYTKSGHKDVHPIERLVWSRLSYVMGILHPTNTPFDANTELILQKSFLDHMWDKPLVDMVGSGALPDFDLRELVSKMNMGIAKHSIELRSFAQAYSAEIRGMVDVVGGDAVDCMIDVARDEGVYLDEPTPEQRRECENFYKNLFAMVLEQNKARTELRTIHIMASLHASLRWNKGQKFKPNDLMDFDHAAAAIAYCDAFFTEQPLKVMVTQRHLGLDKLFGCYVTADASEALKFLNAALQ